MPEKSQGDKIAFTVLLPPEMAKRLQATAASRNMPANDLVIDVLDRNLPRMDQLEGKKRIPYT